MISENSVFVEESRSVGEIRNEPGARLIVRTDHYMSQTRPAPDSRFTPAA
jgi:hypothetical protein